MSGLTVEGDGANKGDGANENMADGEKRSRRRRRGGEATHKKPFLADQLPWQAATYLDDPTQPIDPDGVEAIHDASMRVLE